MPDGQSLVFDSAATNLVEGDTNGQKDIFIKDLRSGVIRRLSLLADGRQVNGNSREPLLSSDGRYMFFQSSSREWTRDTWGGNDCSYVKDLRTGSALRVRTHNSDECVDQVAFARGSETAWLLGYKSAERPLVKTWFSLNLRTGVYTQSRYDDPTTQSKWWVQPTISRDGSKLAFTHSPLTAPGYGVSVMNADGQERRTLRDDGFFGGNPEWYPDGSALVLTDLNTSILKKVDITTGSVTNANVNALSAAVALLAACSNGLSSASWILTGWLIAVYRCWIVPLS
jgi:Tol biopolymer transport system component